MVEIMTPTIFNHICTKIELEYGQGSEKAQYKQWRITNVLSQIFLICQCLDDTTKADGSWLFYNYEGKEHRYYFTDLLAPNVMISDTDAADPRGLSWPEGEPDFVLPEIPAEPEKVIKPLLPTEVKEPTPPTVYNEPTPPTEVSYPGEPPEEMREVLIAADIIELLEAGGLSERTEFGSDAQIDFEHTVGKLVSFENDPVMTVYDYDLTTVIDERIITSAEDIVMPSADMSRAPSKKYTYSFAGWSKVPSGLTGFSRSTPVPDEDFCVFAIYSSEERLYKVTWVTAKGNKDTYYKYGELPSFDGDTSKPSSQTKNYAFDCWYPLPDIIIGEATYTAQYIESERLYSVVWNAADESITQSYSFNALPTPPINPQDYLDGCDFMSFDGWDKEISPTTQDNEFNALYTRTTLVSSEEGTLSLELVDDEYYLVLASSDTVEAGELIRLAAEEGRRVELSLNNITLQLSAETVKALANADTQTISAKKEGENNFSLSIKNSDAEDVSSKCQIRVNVPTSVTSAKNFCVYLMHLGTAKLETPYTLSDGHLIFTSPANATFLFEKLYSITFSKSENGGVMLDSYLYPSGTKISPKFYPAIGYEVRSITITRADTGESIELEDLSGFEMPPSDITVKVTFDKIRFTVSFVVNGETVSSEKYELGAMPTLPKISEKYDEDGYRYIFTGWSPNVSIVTGDATYTAKYSRFLISDSEADAGNAINGFLHGTVLPIALIALGAGALITATIIIIKKRKVISKRLKKNKK